MISVADCVEALSDVSGTSRGGGRRGELRKVAEAYRIQVVTQ